MTGYSVQIMVQVEAHSKAEAIDIVGGSTLIPALPTPQGPARSAATLDFEVAGAERWPDTGIQVAAPAPHPVWLAALEAFDDVE